MRPAVHELGFGYVLMPVLLNAALMVVVAIAFNFVFKWRRYPLSLARSSTPRAPDGCTPTSAEVVDAMRRLESFVDISEADLVRLTRILAEDTSSEAVPPGDESAASTRE